MGGERLVVTGATSGIGLAMVKQFIKDGHLVAGCGRSRKVIDELNATYAANGNLFCVVDVTKKADVESFANEVLKNLGTPTFLLNNAGLTADPCNLWELDDAKFHSVMDVNVTGTFHTIKQFVPAMIQQKQGVIVNFSSEWGRHAGNQQGVYCCSKFAIEGLSKSLALDLPAPLACVPLNPGLINTPMLNTSLGADFANRTRTPEQWAQTGCPFILIINRSHNGKSLTAP